MKGNSREVERPKGKDLVDVMTHLHLRFSWVSLEGKDDDSNWGSQGLAPKTPITSKLHQTDLENKWGEYRIFV